MCQWVRWRIFSFEAIETNSHLVYSTDEAGYYVAPNDNFAMVTELMNMADESGDAIVTITYEYIPSPSDSFAHVKMLWLDIGGCGNSDKPAYANKSFTYSSPEWTATTDGRVTFVGAHLHDGGKHLEVKNSGEVVCNSVAAYGQSPAYIDSMPMNMSMNGMTMEMNMKMAHLSSLTTCTNQGVMKAGDKYSLTAYYNTSEYAPMTNTNGKLEDIMGIALVYFVEGTSVNATNGSTILTHEATGVQQANKTPSTKTSGGLTLAVPMFGSLWCLGFVGLLLFL